MNSEMFVLVNLTPSGNMEVTVSEGRPAGRFMGKIATHYNVVHVYSRAEFNARDEMAIMGKVARMIVREVLR